jgi:hypothetical protein
VNKLLAGAAPIVGKVRTVRNKAVAHSDNSMSYNDWIKQANVTYDQLRELTEIALKVINLLNADNDQDEVHFTELPVQDLEEMLKTLGDLPRPSSGLELCLRLDLAGGLEQLPEHPQTRLAAQRQALFGRRSSLPT